MGGHSRAVLSGSGNPRVWIHSNSDVCRRIEPDLADRLSDHGIEICPLEADGPERLGAFLFDRPCRELFESLRRLSCGGLVRLIAISAQPSEPCDPWPLLAAGASDVLSGPDLTALADQAAARFHRWHQIEGLMQSDEICHHLIGISAVWRNVLREFVEVARFSDASVLICGESGTGKELLARLIHTLDSRPSKGKLVTLDCTTVVPSLSGSEFFGHDKGAFTGAVAPRDGVFAEADGGTLFLDEIGELPLELQAELLRVIQEGTYKRVGSNSWRKTSFRLVCATNRNLGAMRTEGTFRTDLYYRIAAWSATLPPLRERSEDIPVLVDHFLRLLLPGDEVPRITPPVAEILSKRSYPGNIRELRQLVARMTTRHVGFDLTPGDVPLEDRPPPLAVTNGFERPSELKSAVQGCLDVGMTLKEISRAAGEEAIRLALDFEGGNLKRAAQRLGVTDRALQLRRASNRDGQVRPLLSP